MFSRTKQGGKKQTLYITTDIFNIDTYTGNGINQSITNNIDLLNNGGMVLFKENNAVTDFKLYDANTKELITNTNDIQSTQANGLTSFNNNGFSIGTRLSSNALNYVAYTFRKASKFFDIVKYASSSPSHSLGVVPELIISKNLDYATNDWVVYHKDYLTNYQLLLNSPSAKVNTNMFYSTVPTVSSFGTNVASYSGVNSIVIDGPNSGYTSAPTVTITNASGDITGSGASATANMVVNSIDYSTAFIAAPVIASPGYFTSIPADASTNVGTGVIRVNSLGSIPNAGGEITGVRNYEGAAFTNKHNSASPTVSFSNSGYGNGVQFGTPSTTAYGLTINSITVNSGGVYTNIPTVSLSGTLTSGTALPTISVSYSALPRTITSLNVTGGSGYTTAPTVTFPNMPGTSVTTALNTSIQNGKGIATINQTSQGSQYPASGNTVTVNTSTGSGATFNIATGTGVRYYVPLTGACTFNSTVNSITGAGVPTLTAAIEPPPITGGTPATFSVVADPVNIYQLLAICNTGNTAISNLGSGFELPISAYITNPAYRHGEVLTVVPGAMTGGGIITAVPSAGNTSYYQIATSPANRTAVAAGITVTLTQTGTATGSGFSAYVQSSDLTTISGGYTLTSVTIISGGTGYFNDGLGNNGLVLSFSYSGPALGGSSILQANIESRVTSGFTITPRQYSIGSVTISTNGSYTSAEAAAISTDGGVTIIGNNSTGTGLSTAHASTNVLSTSYQVTSVTCNTAGQGYDYLTNYIIAVRQPSQSNVVICTYRIGVNSSYIHYLYPLIITNVNSGSNYALTDTVTVNSGSGYGSGAIVSIATLTPSAYPVTATLNTGGTGIDATPVISGGVGGSGFGISANLTTPTYTITGLSLSGGGGYYNGLSLSGLATYATTAATTTINTTQYYTLNSLSVTNMGQFYIANECSLTIGGYSANLDFLPRRYPITSVSIINNGYGSFTNTNTVSALFYDGAIIAQVTASVVGETNLYSIQSFNIVSGNNYALPPVVTIPGTTAHSTLGSAIPGNYVSYLFATLEGISKVGSYTGNGATLAVDCGFSAGARMVLIKQTDSAGDWYLWDNTRGITSGNDPHLSLNLTSAEVNTDDSIDPYLLGFAVNQTSTNINTLNGSYIFLAIA